MMIVDRHKNTKLQLSLCRVLLPAVAVACFYHLVVVQRKLVITHTHTRIYFVARRVNERDKTQLAATAFVPPLHCGFNECVCVRCI